MTYYTVAVREPTVMDRQTLVPTISTVISANYVLGEIFGEQSFFDA